MIDRTHPLPMIRQCPSLALSRSTAYDRPMAVSAADLALMSRIDELHLDHPFAGARMLRALLRREGHEIGRTRMRTMMARMGIEALYRKPYTSQRHSAHRVYPYRFRHLALTRPNHVWAADSTYFPMSRGFVSLFAVLDRASRRVLAGQLSNTLTTDFCIEAEALASYGTPTIFNTDQGCQFTSQEFTGLLKDHGIQISMDGAGCWRDNVFVERLWKSIKYELVYLHAYETVSDAQQGLERYPTFYLHQTPPHRALDGKTPEESYCDILTTRLTAAQSAYCEAPLKA